MGLFRLNRGSLMVKGRGRGIWKGGLERREEKDRENLQILQ